MTNQDLGPKPTSSSHDTAVALVQQARRRLVPIRRTFVQQGTQRKPLVGPLARIVRKRDERALDLYLLMRALATADPYDATQHAEVWARALNLVGSSGVATVSRIWTRLVKYKLVK